MKACEKFKKKLLTPHNISSFDVAKISSNANFLKQREQANKGFILI